MWSDDEHAPAASFPTTNVTGDRGVVLCCRRARALLRNVLRETRGSLMFEEMLMSHGSGLFCGKVSDCKRRNRCRSPRAAHDSEIDYKHDGLFMLHIL